MNKQIVVLLCSSSFVVACGGSDNRPAQSAYDPQTTSATTETAPTPMTTPPAATVLTPEPAAPSTMGTSPGQTYPSTDTSSATGSGWGNGSSTKSAGSNTNTGSANTNTGTANANTGSGSGSTSANTPSATPPPAAPAPDNSGVNKRDKNSSALTPMDQGTSDGERRITANIRKLVVGDKSLSFTAKNVKIITVGTKVTLRGPVKSDQEKTAIESYARGIAGVTEVDDQLEVKK